MNIWIVNFPLPPSVNEYLMPVAGGVSRNKKGKLYQKGRWVKTEPHRIFMKKCLEWAKIHEEAWEMIRTTIHAEVAAARAQNQRIAFQVDTYFAFESSRIWTKNNLPERLDADNRLKPCRDALSELLGIDDKYFFSGFFEKVSAQTKDQECTYLRITKTAPRTLHEIRMQIKKDRQDSLSSALSQESQSPSGT